MSDLHIANRLFLPIDGVTETFAFLGRRGNGKTYAATLMAEQMLDAGAQIVALDPVGVWWGLRLMKDGVTPGYSIPVFGGLHGDIPLQPTAGALMADVVCDRGISAVLDVSQMIAAEQAKFGYHFAKRFFQRKKALPSAVHVFIEEAQEFVPQNLGPGGGEAAHMLHEFERLIKLGRNFGVGISLISQRPQEVNKKALNQTECLFAFQMTGTHERKAIREWTNAQGIENVNVMDVLPTLERGNPICWSPQWLGMSKVVQIREKQTLDVSATPKVGAKPVAPQQLGDLDMEQIQQDMAATIERAKAEDPKELRKRIRNLERELQDSLAKSGAPVETIRELPVFRDGEVERLETTLASITEVFDRESIAATQRQEAFERFHRSLEGSIQMLAVAIADAKPGSQQRPGPLISKKVRLIGLTQRPAALRERAEPQDTDSLVVPAAVTGPEERVLRALEWLEVTGIPQPGKEIVGFVARYSPTASSFTNPCSKLRGRGYIDYPQPGHISLTEVGRALVDEYYPHTTKPGTIEELHQMVLGRLTGPQRRLLEPLLAAYPGTLSNDDLAQQASYSVEASSFTNPRSSLRTLGLAVYPSAGTTQAAPFLFFDA